MAQQLPPLPPPPHITGNHPNYDGNNNKVVAVVVIYRLSLRMHSVVTTIRNIPRRIDVENFNDETPNNVTPPLLLVVAPKEQVTGILTVAVRGMGRGGIG
jgi:hypothetical protein